MSRPTKSKVYSYTVPPTDPAFLPSARRHLARLSVDPTMTENLADLGFADLITGNHLSRTKEITGIYMTYIYQKAPIAAVEEFFRRLMAMRTNCEKRPQDKGRLWNFLRGYIDYVEETGGRQPSKPELKAYLLARTDKYFNLPDSGDHKAWTRMLKETCLDQLANR